jgi:hypothetical protein
VNCSHTDGNPTTASAPDRECDQLKSRECDQLKSREGDQLKLAARRDCGEISMAGELFAHRRKSDDRERAALVKAKVGIEEALAALFDQTTLGSPCPNPSCGAIGMLKIVHGGDGWLCEVCAARGDVIELVRAVRQCGFHAALEFLEVEVAGARCRKTGDLFGRRGGG